MEECRDFYTYILFDTRKLKGKYVYNDLIFDYEPFYVGKGKWSYGKFKKGHKRKERFEKHFYNLKDDTNTFKKSIVRKIKKETGDNPLVKIYDLNLTNDEAFEQEKWLIKQIGRRNLNEGTLTNLDDGGEGGSGCIWTKESLKRLKEAQLKPEYKKKISESTKQCWKNPDYRKKVIKTGYNHPGRRVIYLFNLEGKQLKKFDFLKDCATYLETSSPNIKKVIDRKTSWNEKYFISYNSSLNISEYKLTRSKSLKVKPEDKFIFENNVLIKKHCNRCDYYKDISEFGKNKNLTNGIALYCKECDSNRQKQPRNKKEKFKEYDRGLSKKFKYDKDNNPIEKHCNKCDTYKSIEEFGRNKNLKHEVELYCKECNRKRNKKPRNSKYITKAKL